MSGLFLPVAYSDAWELASPLLTIDDSAQYQSYLEHMPEGYFIPEYAFTRESLPAPMKRVKSKGVPNIQASTVLPIFREWLHLL